MSDDGTLSGITTFQTTCLENGEYSPLEALSCQAIKVSVVGKARNAVNNNPISSATVRVTQGTHSQSVETDESGQFSYFASPGAAEIDVTRQGFIELHSELTLTGDIAVGTGADVSMSPVLPPNDWRVVLTWAGTPADLDSHLRYGSCLLIYYNRHTYCEGIRASLDVDDVDGYGPETTTIENVGSCDASNCDISFRVHNYSHRRSPGFDQAIVELYNGERMVQKFTPSPSAVNADYWDVFVLDGKTGELK